MKQKLLKSMLLLCALVFGGASSAWGDDVYYTFTTKANGSNNAYASTYDVTIGGINWNVPGNQYTDGGLRIGGKGGSETTSVSTYNRVITAKSSIDKAITKITFNHGGISNTNCVVNSVTLTVANNSSFTDGVDYELTPSFSLNTNDCFDFYPTSPATEFAKDSYYKFTINLTITGKSNYFLLVKSIDFYYAGSGGSESSVSLSSNTIEATDAAKEGTINVTYNNLTDYASDIVFVGSDGTTPAEYDWLDAEINATDNTKLDYTIDANTGAVRTAYMRVYVVDNTLGELYSPVITVTQAAKTVAKPTFNIEGGSYMQGTNITISSAGNTVYYNLTTDGSTPATPTKASTEYTAPIVLGSGTTKITAIAYDAYGNASGTTTRTYTGIATATLPFSWTGTKTAGKDELAGETGVAVSLGSNYAESNAPYRLKFDGAGKNVTIFTDVKPEVVTFTARLYEATAGDGSKFKVQGSADGVTYIDIEEFTIKGAKDDTFEFTTSNAFAATHRAVKLVMSSKEKNVGVGTICINCVPVTLNASGYATFASTYPLDFSDDSEFSAWQITGVSGNTISFSQITGTVAANTGVLLKGTASATVNIPVAASGATLATNKLVGITTATDVAADTYYGLSDNKFVKVNAGTVPAGKALLPVSAVGAGVKEFTFIFDDKETGIRTIEKVSAEEAAQIFDLSGRRLSKMQKGFNIVNGKKILF